MNNLTKIKSLLAESSPKPRDDKKVFFKTGPGSYAEHDQFIGVSVPILRKIAKDFVGLTITEIQTLIESKINEERFLALVILIFQYEKADNNLKDELYKFYLHNLKYVNNWNLVDTSAHLILGAHLWDKNRDGLLTFAASKIMWEQRISIVTSWYFIRKNDLKWTFKIAPLLLNDSHDLIHKAVGWMLREAGKRDENQLIKFLDQYSKAMPRTMLRYSIEKFPEDVRKSYLIR